MSRSGLPNMYIQPCYLPLHDGQVETCHLSTRIQKVKDMNHKRCNSSFRCDQKTSYYHQRSWWHYCFQLYPKNGFPQITDGLLKDIKKQEWNDNTKMISRKKESEMDIIIGLREKKLKLFFEKWPKNLNKQRFTRWFLNPTVPCNETRLLLGL